MNATLELRAPEASAGAVGEAVEVRGVSKSFGSTRALIDVSMSVPVGDVRALVGRNGAGKSTMVSLLSGLLTPDSGAVSIGGLAPGSSRAVACVYQHSRLVPALTVAENVIIGSYPRGRFGRIDWKEIDRRARTILAPWGLENFASMVVEDLDPVQAKVVEICRALARKPRVLLLDEPTAGLDRRDAEHLFGFIEQLKQQRVTILYVSHHLDEIYRLCHSATVLRDSRHVVSAPLAELPKQELVKAMVGPQIGAVSSGQSLVDARTAAPHRVATADDAGLVVRGLSYSGRLIDFHLTVNKGECVGVAGLEGAGKAELGAILAGLVEPDQGQVLVHGKKLRLGDVRRALEAGIGYVPQNRHVQGMVLSLPVSENATMTAARRLARPLIPGVLDVLLQSDRDRVYDRLARMWQIVAASPQQHISALSGGNQQKCVMARGLATGPKVLVLQNPTAGIDVAAKASITRTLRQVLADGASVVVISEDADDFALCSRIVVLNRGRVGRILGDRWTEDELVAVMQGVD